jgi:DNA-binding response OmpR family regulator
VAIILVVDDDPAGRRLTQYMLSSEGHEVITASNGIQGLQVATQQSPDLVILDVMLPGLDGFEVCRRLRTQAKTAATPIIILSGKTQSSDHDTGIKMGANEYLVKPVDRKELIATIERLLGEAEKITETKGKLIAFIGTRGGVGTSTITLNVAVALQKAGKSAILLDLNPSYGALAEMTGLKTERSISGLFKDASGTIDVEELKVFFEQHSSGFRLLWCESYPEESDKYHPDDIKALCYELERLGDYVIADVPASPNDNAIAVLTVADSIILIAGTGKESPDRINASVARLKRFGVNEENIKILAIDRAGNEDESLEILSSTPGSLPLVGAVRLCKDECAEAEQQGTPVILSAPSSGIAEDIHTLTSKIIELS